MVFCFNNWAKNFLFKCCECCDWLTRHPQAVLISNKDYFKLTNIIQSSGCIYTVQTVAHSIEPASVEKPILA